MNESQPVWVHRYNVSMASMGNSENLADFGNFYGAKTQQLDDVEPSVDYQSYMVNVLREDAARKTEIPANASNQLANPSSEIATGVVSLSQLLDVTLFRIHDDFVHMLELGQPRSPHTRKTMLATFARNSYCRVVSFYGTAKWMSHIEKVKTAGMIMKELADIQDDYTDTANLLHELSHRTLPLSKLPPLQVSIAVEVLATGKYLRFPHTIAEKLLGKPDAVDNINNEKADEITVKDLDSEAVLERQMRARLIQPHAFDSLQQRSADTSIHVEVDGAITILSIAGEFKVGLTLNGVGTGANWQIVSLELFNQNADNASQTNSAQAFTMLRRNFINYLHSLMAANASTKLKSESEEKKLVLPIEETDDKTIPVRKVEDDLAEVKEPSAVFDRQPPMTKQVYAVLQDLCNELKLQNIITDADVFMRAYLKIDRKISHPATLPYQVVFIPATPSESASSVQVTYWRDPSTNESNRVTFSVSSTSPILHIKHNPPLLLKDSSRFSSLANTPVTNVNFSTYLPSLFRLRSMERLLLLYVSLKPFIGNLVLHICGSPQIDFLHISLPVQLLRNTPSQKRLPSSLITSVSAAPACSLRIYGNCYSDGKLYVSRQHFFENVLKKLLGPPGIEQMNDSLDKFEVEINTLIGKFTLLIRNSYAEVGEAGVTKVKQTRTNPSDGGDDRNTDELIQKVIREVTAVDQLVQQCLSGRFAANSTGLLKL